MPTIALQLAEEKRIGLDDKLANYLPDLPHADRITLRMLLNMTSGYADYVPDETFNLEFYANPFRHWTPEELINIGVSKPLRFEPGTNWGYAHTGYVIMGRVIEKVTGKPLGEVMAERIFMPLGLRDTVATVTAEIQPPVLHAFSSERRVPLGIAEGVRFYEEFDLLESVLDDRPWRRPDQQYLRPHHYRVAVGTGTLLSPESYEAMTGPALIGFGKPTAECPTCRTLDETFHYGLGVFLYGPWIAQSPLFGGYAATRGVSAREEDRDCGRRDLFRGRLRRERATTAATPAPTSSGRSPSISPRRDAVSGGYQPPPPPPPPPPPEPPPPPPPEKPDDEDFGAGTEL